MLRRITFPAVLAVTAALLVLAGCGSSSSDDKLAPISADQLLQQTAVAVHGQQAVAFDLSATVDARSNDPQMQQFFSDPIKIALKGAADNDAVQLDALLGARGDEYRFGVLADPKQAFVKFADQWYGPSQGMTGTTKAAQEAHPEADFDIKRVAKLKHLLVGEVHEGPKTDDVETWEFRGTYNPKTVIKLAKQSGNDITASDRALIKQFADATQLRLVVGRDDHLPRELDVTVNVPTDSADALRQMQLDSLTISMNVKLSDWGKPVNVSAPPNAKPMEALNQAVTEALMKAMGQ